MAQTTSRVDPKAAYDGITVITAGVHSSTAPIALPRNQLAWGVNLDCRTDFMRPRAGWTRHPLSFLDGTGTPSATVQAQFEDAIFEGAIVFERFSQIVTMIGGRLFRIDPNAWSVTDVSTPGDLNPSNRYRAWFCEVENWVIAQDGVSIPWIYDGASAVRSDTIGAGGKAQVPIGKAMCYAQGRLHVSYASGRAFVIGDIVGGDSGSAAYDFKDSVLYFTENDVINGGGSFSVPINAGLITAFRPLAQIDTSMGQGPTAVFTTNAIFSLNLPVDRTTWATVNFPIGTVSNVANGMTSDRCTPNVNGDVWGRAPDGWRSFLVARRDFTSAWVNAPLSQEVSRAVDGDDENLLGYASAAYFDQRLLGTTRPYRVWDHGIVHQGFVQLDFQPVASLSERNPLPTWLGNMTGVRVLQVLTGNINGVPRCFVFALSAANKIELWEVTRKASADSNGATSTPIEWNFETAAFSFMSAGGSGVAPSTLPGRELWSLDGGRLFVDQIDGPVSFTFEYRPDQDECWHYWHAWSVCASDTTCAAGGCLATPPNLRAQYRKPFFLPHPERTCDPVTNKPYFIGREFQVRATIVGRCRVKMLELIAHAQQEDVSGVCAGTEACAAVACCPPDDYNYVIPAAPPAPPPSIPTGACCTSGVCTIATRTACEEGGGTYLGDGTDCSGTPCAEPPPTPTGACCVDGVCSIATEAACVANGGTYQGNGSVCGADACRPALPPWPPLAPASPPFDCAEFTVHTESCLRVTDPDTGLAAYVGCAPGALSPNDYIATYGAPGCLEAWADAAWAYFLALGIPYGRARLAWHVVHTTGDGYMATQVFPDQAGGYAGVIDLDMKIVVETCPP